MRKYDTHGVAEAGDSWDDDFISRTEGEFAVRLFRGGKPMCKPKTITKLPIILLSGSFIFLSNPSNADHFLSRKSENMTGGPGQNELLVKISKRKEFGESGDVIVRGGHVPNLLESGKNVYLYFQWFPRDVDEKKWFDHIGVSIRETPNWHDAAEGLGRVGSQWNDTIGVNISGIPKRLLGRQGRPMDPAAVNLPDGRIRLFFTLEKFQPHNKVLGDARIHSAISEDGVNFSYESSPRFQIESVDLRDPAVAYFKDKWHLYSPDQKHKGTGYYATSSDGLNFVRQPNVKVRERGDWLGNATISDDQIYFFGTVWVGHSSNGADWKSNRSRGLGPDPAAIRLKNGSWLGVSFREMK
jgi:hypothetical protein